jgi:DNA processing protein
MGFRECAPTRRRGRRFHPHTAVAWTSQANICSTIRSSLVTLETQSSLLALCAIDCANWNVIAREAQRAGGLARLLTAEITEKSEEARATQKILRDALSDLDSPRERVAEEMARAAEVGARLVTVLDDDYPANLRVIYNPPPFLFYRGHLEREDTRSVAVVGTREASEEGLRSARKMARLLVEAGVTVLSGLALGIDAAGHEEALAQGGRTIAVLGTGILRSYPKENAELGERIVESGALVSQFWPSQPPTRYSFPRRNVVTSGLSQGTVVIEASKTSGAKMQARLALEHGKRVFLVSRLVTSQTWAQKYVADRGAIEVTSVEDVLQRLRSPEAIEQVSAGRRQLALELG